MCTYINHTASVKGAGRGAKGWFKVSQATVGFDHPTFTSCEHALLIDFVDPDGGDLSSRVAVELDLESGRSLLATLSETIAAADASGVA